MWARVWGCELIRDHFFGHASFPAHDNDVQTRYQRKSYQTDAVYIFYIAGYDAPFHLSEECANANIASPRAIVLTSAIGGTFGWFLQLVVAYTVIDIGAVIDSDIGQPWAAYLQQVLPNSVTNAILALTIICAFSMGQGCMVAASRVTFAYSRDGCFPCSWWMARVNRHVSRLHFLSVLSAPLSRTFSFNS